MIQIDPLGTLNMQKICQPHGGTRYKVITFHHLGTINVSRCQVSSLNIRNLLVALEEKAEDCHSNDSLSSGDRAYLYLICISNFTAIHPIMVKIIHPKHLSASWLMLQEKLEDHQSHSASSYGDHESLYKL